MITIKADMANALNYALSELEFVQQVSYTCILGTITPRVEAFREEDATEVVIYFQGENLEIDAVDHTNGWQGETSWDTLKKLQSLIESY